MNVNVKTHTLTDLFRKEWKLYVEDVPKAGVVHKVEMAKHSDSLPRIQRSVKFALLLM